MSAMIVKIASINFIMSMITQIYASKLYRQLILLVLSHHIDLISGPSLVKHVSVIQ